MNRDFRDVFCALNDAGAEYLLVGGYAVMHYAEPRFTKDLDILVRPTDANARRVLRALESFGAPVGGVAPATSPIAAGSPRLDYPPAVGSSSDGSTGRNRRAMGSSTASNGATRAPSLSS